MMSPETEPIWPERISAIGIPSKLTEIRAEADATSPETPDHIAKVERIRHVLEYIESELVVRDPHLVSDATLTQILNQLNQLHMQLANWTSNSNVANLGNAMSQLDGLLTTMGAIPVRLGLESSQAEVASLRRSVGQYRGQVDRELEGVKEEAAKAAEAFASRADASSKTVQELDAQIARLRDEMAQTLNAARDQANQQQNTFASGQDQRQEAFSKLLEETRDEASATQEQLKTSATAEIDKFLEAHELQLQTAERAKDRIEEILGIVSEEALVGAYSKNAGTERKQADLWRWISVSSIISSVAIAIWIVASTAGATTDWDQFAGKVALAVPFAAVATYAAKQSGEHRHVQREGEHMALQLTALRPYLEDLTDEDGRDKLLTDIAGKIFGRPRREGAAENGVGETPASMPQLIALVREFGKIGK